MGTLGTARNGFGPLDVGLVDVCAADLDRVDSDLVTTGLAVFERVDTNPIDSDLTGLDRVSGRLGSLRRSVSSSGWAEPRTPLPVLSSSGQSHPLCRVPVGRAELLALLPLPLVSREALLACRVSKRLVEMLVSLPSRSVSRRPCPTC